MKRQSTVLAITSGKGGVGKSVLSVNLAEALAAAGYRVALVDADLGQGACALLMNEQPPAGVADILLSGGDLKDVFYRTEGGLTLVQAAAEPGQADGREGELFALLDGALDRLRASHDFVLIDTPAGVDAPVRWALDRAALALLVLVGEPTAVADAYRLVKLVWQADPGYTFTTVVNYADSEDEARSIAERFNAVTTRFTGEVTTYLGWVPFSSDIRRAVLEQCPFVRTSSSASDAIGVLAATLVRGLTTGSKKSARHAS